VTSETETITVCSGKIIANVVMAAASPAALRRPYATVGTSAKIETETGLFSLMLRRVLPG
jgi:hypothetical protein